MRTMPSLLLALAGWASLATADLPVHTVLSHVLGEWDIFLGKKLSDRPMNCGGSAPNRNVDNLRPALIDYGSFVNQHVGVGHQMSVRLSDTGNSTKHEGAGRESWVRLGVKDLSGDVVGSWTMVYDEGMELRLGNLRLLGIFKYAFAKHKAGCGMPADGDNENDYGKTDCYETDPGRLSMGWMLDTGNAHQGGDRALRWGCWYGERKGETKSSFVRSVEHPRGLVRPMSRFVQVHNNVPSSWTAKFHPQFEGLDTDSLAKYLKKFSWHKMPHTDANNDYSDSQYRQGEPHFVQTHSKGIGFPCQSLKRDHEDENVCTVKHGMEGLTDYDTIYGQDVGDVCMANVSVASNENESSATGTAGHDTLPSKFSWGDPFLTEGWTDDSLLNQGECGSCYAVAATWSLQARSHILLKKMLKDKAHILTEEPDLSPKTVVSCSPYNQGCDGGFPYLVGKHMHEFGAGSAKCQPYEASDGGCLIGLGDIPGTPDDTPDSCKAQTRWYARDYHYVGGCYECCTAAAMQHEIMHHGPLAVALDAPSSLFMYDTGIFDSLPIDSGKYCDDPNKGLNGWQFTNHAVVIVGWMMAEPIRAGEQERPVWIVRNSWGQKWGQAGYFMVPRGENYAGIESQAVAIDPDLTRGRPAALLQS